MDMIMTSAKNDQEEDDDEEEEEEFTIKKEPSPHSRGLFFSPKKYSCLPNNTYLHFYYIFQFGR